MKTSNFENRLTALQSNMLNMAFILTSSRDNAYSLLNATNDIMLRNEKTSGEEKDLKKKTFAVMKQVFNSRFAPKIKTVHLADRRTEVYSMKITHEEESLPYGVMSAVMLQHALEKMDSTYRTPCELYLKGYTREEICEMTSLPETTVSGRLKYTVKKIYALLRAGM